MYSVLNMHSVLCTDSCRPWRWEGSAVQAVGANSLEPILFSFSAFLLSCFCLSLEGSVMLFVYRVLCSIQYSVQSNV